MASTATLSLSPWAAEALSLAEQREIAARLVDLHARCRVIKSREGWGITVDSWAQDAHFDPIHQVKRHHQRGHLADLVQSAIDAYATTAFAYTTDELVVIASQSGMDVTRA